MTLPNDDNPILDQAYAEDNLDTPQPIREMPCWRCKKSFSLDHSHCPFCRASNRNFPATFQLSSTKNNSNPLSDIIPRGMKVVLWSFGILLLTSIVFGAMIHLDSSWEKLPLRQAQDRLFSYTLWFSVFDSLIIFVSLCIIPKPKPSILTSPNPLKIWFLGFPLLLVSLLTNIGYHELLNAYIGPGPNWDRIDISYSYNPVCVTLLFCVMPGIVEEVYFRHIALGHLRTITSETSAIWISSLMFGLAHIFAPLSMPYLILVGVLLGYLRVYSGSLLLPMILHGIHNAVVVILLEEP